MRAQITPLPETSSARSRSTPTSGGCRSSIDQALSLATGLSPRMLRGVVTNIDDPLRLAYLLASLLDMKAEDKQQLLEDDDLLGEARGGRDGARPRDRAARAQGQDRVARRSRR